MHTYTRTLRSACASVAAAALMLTSACGLEETPAEVKEEAADTADAVDADDAEGDAEPAEDGHADATAQVGDLVGVGDWDVKVTEVQQDAAGAIAKANQFNDKASGQYVLVTYEATYTGEERTADTLFDLSWSFTTSDNQIHDPASQVTPADNKEWPSEARAGGTVEQQVLFDLEPDLISGGLLTVESYDGDLDKVYADFEF